MFRRHRFRPRRTIPQQWEWAGGASRLTNAVANAAGPSAVQLLRTDVGGIAPVTIQTLSCKLLIGALDVWTTGGAVGDLILRYDALCIVPCQNGALPALADIPDPGSTLFGQYTFLWWRRTAVQVGVNAYLSASATQIPYGNAIKTRGFKLRPNQQLLWVTSAISPMTVPSTAVSTGSLSARMLLRKVA